MYVQTNKTHVLVVIVRGSIFTFPVDLSIYQQRTIFRYPTAPSMFLLLDMFETCNLDLD
jgi:hypothetical protein